jgi:putative addiction module component (TIGR02574 family)
MLPAMTKSAKDLVESAKRLPPVERAALIEALLDSMDAPDAIVDARWTVEAESRLAAYEAGELQSMDADAVLSQLRK